MNNEYLTWLHYECERAAASLHLALEGIDSADFQGSERQVREGLYRINQVRQGIEVEQRDRRRREAQGVVTVEAVAV